MFSFLCYNKEVAGSFFLYPIVKKDVIHGTMEYGEFPFQSFGRFF